MRFIKKLAILFLLTFPLAASSLPGSCVSYAGQDPRLKEMIRLADAIHGKFQVPWTYAQKVVELAYEAAKKSTAVTALDVLAVIYIESSFREAAVHHIGPSVGLMQINVLHHKIPDLKKPEVNINAGVDILDEYHQKGRDISYTLVSYNAGPSRAKQLCSKSGACETAYVKKFRKAREWLKGVKNNKEFKT